MLRNTSLRFQQDGSYRFVKFIFTPDAGIETLDAATALRLAGEEPDYHIKDLFNAIERDDYPTWTLNVQVIEPEDLADAPIDIFDNTFTWPHAKYPLRPVGKLVLNKNVRFCAGFSPVLILISRL